MSNTIGHTESSNEDVFRDRVVRLFKFLRELALLKGKIVYPFSTSSDVINYFLVTFWGKLDRESLFNNFPVASIEQQSSY